MATTFTIKLEEQIIGTTEFEFADVPMGVVYGKINFINIESPYLLFKNYCLANNIHINYDSEKERLIDTAIIPNLRIYYNDFKEELKSWGSSISGIEISDDVFEFEITLYGLEYETMSTLFKHHFDEYFK
ncbi:hypothetical protein [Empedobacter sp. UBA5987]|uniref:hypothetical protein n=1 Tax=Empedobacter sp. UBA5987 TaxID=1946444 RepID=UPI0025BAB844|nr:hypothetical protein [Empedobacter sp. UBA5987]